MTSKVHYSPAAVRDLDRIWAEVYEASKSTTIAGTYLDDLMDKVERKAEFPESGSPLYYENMFTGYRYVVFKSYMAFYRIEGDELLVDRVLFGKSGYIRHLHIE